MRRGLLFGLLLALTILLTSTPTSAQTVNPTKLEFDHSDYAAVTSYEVGYYLGTAATPYWSATVTKAQIAVVSAATSTYTFTLARPAFGQFTAKLRAAYTNADGTAGQTPWSDPSGPFVLSPSAIAPPRPKP